MQPTLPLIQLSNTLTAAQRDTFIASSQNQHLNDLNERVNFLQTRKRDSKLTYDTKAD